MPNFSIHIHVNIMLSGGRNISVLKFTFRYANNVVVVEEIQWFKVRLACDFGGTYVSQLISFPTLDVGFISKLPGAMLFQYEATVF